MTEQELHDARRAELLAGIQGALSGPSAPAAPVDPGPNATQIQRDIYTAAVKDAAVHATLSKPTDQVTSDERAQLWKEVLDCARRGWQ